MDTQLLLVFWGCTVLGATAGLMGSSAFLEKKSLLTDGLSHALLPGLVLGYWISQSKDLPFLLVGAALSSAIGAWLSDFLQKNSKLSSDAAIGIVLGGFFGLGTLFLSALQHAESGNQSGLDQFLFGKAASLGVQHVLIISVVCILLVCHFVYHYREVKIYLFDPVYAQTAGISSKRISRLLLGSYILTAAIGVQAVGAILISSMLILPSVAARMWGSTFKGMIAIAVSIGAFGALAGCYISAKFAHMPTGPVVVLVLGSIVLISLFVNPANGWIKKWSLKTIRRWQISSENQLKAAYLHIERNYHPSSRSEYLAHPITLAGYFNRYAQLRGWIVRRSQSWYFSEQGLVCAESVVRKHRLWELYLNKHLQLHPNHVHLSAEWMEHFLGPREEKVLMNLLDQPLADPHSKQIPPL
ncbi:MAG TPA: iron chelate uptake ABC transporter family permease subunit [Luteibaculaceae bacterium]|nr:iron chelate uptake ABC transporter family permease subunit [Luteibaculaceae bacterium]